MLTRNTRSFSELTDNSLVPVPLVDTAAHIGKAELLWHNEISTNDLIQYTAKEKYLVLVAKPNSFHFYKEYLPKTMQQTSQVTHTLGNLLIIGVEALPANEKDIIIQHLGSHYQSNIPKPEPKPPTNKDTL